MSVVVVVCTVMAIVSELSHQWFHPTHICDASTV